MEEILIWGEGHYVIQLHVFIFEFDMFYIISFAFRFEQMIVTVHSGVY